MEEDRARVGLLVRGIVQGVGMRPFAFSLAQRHHVGGRVKNRTDGVWIEVEGLQRDVAQFVEAFRAEASSLALARIDGIEAAPQPLRGDAEFSIETSAEIGGRATFVAPDAATCEDCVRELLDPSDRRHQYPFVNCTRCGPRLTIVTSLPYDRERTTMAAFVMCDACRAEYDEPADRRFHAQPIACPACGPQVRISTGAADALEEARVLIARGAIVAVKGIGGYHLACDARSENAVRELRRRKRRDDKPFAIMVPDVAAADALVHLDDVARALLRDPARPIVLARRRASAEVADAVAPGMNRLGVMLPYTPLHHLLVRSPLVMTSGNVTDEPIAFEDADAERRLGPVADAMLAHDRPIHLRCDDSIAHVLDGAPAVLRRSRGYAPAPLRLPGALARPTLALGGHLKAVFAIGEGHDVFPSHHLGDLDHFEAWLAYREGLERWLELLGARPERVVCDLHPDYATTILAEELGLPRLAVQHHEAHAAGVMAEHGLERAIAVVFDGAGHGGDGAVWGGEIFAGSAGKLVRHAHLRYVRLPGGDRAAREPWRMARAYAADAGLEAPAEVVRAAAHAPWTSSAGRLFDAVAALAGVRTHAAYEAQAAMELQALAERGPDDAEPYDFDALDTRPVIRAVARDVERGVDVAIIARRFHETLAAMVADAAVAIHLRSGIADVALSGGVFANALLAARTAARLRAAGLTPWFARRSPGNDGGLAYGQLAHVAAQDMRGGEA